MIQASHTHNSEAEEIESWLGPVIQDLIERANEEDERLTTLQNELTGRIDYAVTRERVSREILTKNCIRFERLCIDLHARISALEEEVRTLREANNGR